MPQESWRTPVVVLSAGILIGVLTTGVRHSFGLYLTPMSQTFGWGREVFSFGMALQSLLWGLTAPLIGMIAERYGAGRVIFAGGLLYAAGVFLISSSSTPLLLILTLGVVMALGVSAAGFSVPLGVVGRAAGDQRRSLYIGYFMAGGSMGMFLMVPLSQLLISSRGWQNTLVIMSLGCLLIPLLAYAFKEKPQPASSASGAANPWQALKQAGRERRFWLLFSGFFVCGFHVFFIAVHLPAYLQDRGMSPTVGALALSLIGLFNILGSLTAGYLGGRWSKRWGLTGIYLGRGVAIVIFLLVPLSTASVVIFASVMGFLWLSTVPFTSGLVGQMYGVRYLSTLFGLIFLGHQVGGFLGAWGGGLVFDRTGSYDAVWVASIALAVLAALLHIPIDERSPEQMQATAPQPSLAGETP